MGALGFATENNIIKLEVTARYVGLLLAPTEGFGLRPRIVGLWPRPLVMGVEFIKNSPTIQGT